MQAEDWPMQQRRATASQWAEVDPVLRKGEIGVELSAGSDLPARHKVGDGVRSWTELPYVATTPSALPTAVKTSAYSAIAGDLVLADAAAGGFTVTLPPSPPDHTMVWVKKLDGTTNSVIVQRRGTDVFNSPGGSSTLQLLIPGQSAAVQYSSGIWHVLANGTPVAALDSRYDARYLRPMSMTLPRGGVLRLMNTSDGSRDHEYAYLRFAADVAELGTAFKGSGTSRAVRLGVSSTHGSETLQRYLHVANAAPFFSFTWGATRATGRMVSFGDSSSCSAATGVQSVVSIAPTVDQSGSAGYTTLLINPRESATGSGPKLLADFQVDDTSKLSVDHRGSIIFGNGPLILSGAGNPEGEVAAPVGSIFCRSDGGSRAALYVKEAGRGSTGWVAK